MHHVTGCLGEYFASDFSPARRNGTVAEPGHHFEWAYLLHRYQMLGLGTEGRALSTQLYRHGLRLGWDKRYGGVYDEVDQHTGRVRTPSKRIWPYLELLKADAAHGATDVLPRRLAFFLAHYIRPDGTWTEYLARDLTPMTTYLPGSSGYHLYLGLTEALRALRGAAPAPHGPSTVDSPGRDTADRGSAAGRAGGSGPGRPDGQRSSASSRA